MDSHQFFLGWILFQLGFRDFSFAAQIYKLQMHLQCTSSTIMAVLVLYTTIYILILHFFPLFSFLSFNSLSCDSSFRASLEFCCRFGISIYIYFISYIYMYDANRSIILNRKREKRNFYIFTRNFFEDSERWKQAYIEHFCKVLCNQLEYIPLKWI